MLRVSRRRMRRLCAEGIDIQVRRPQAPTTAKFNQIQYGKTMKHLVAEEFNSNVTVVFEDGTTTTGTLVVGADGANSVVRQSVLIDGIGQALPSSYGGVNMHVCYHDASVSTAIREYLSPIQAIGVHPRGYWLWLSLQDVPDADKPQDWTFQLQWSFELGPKTATLSSLDLGHLKREAAGFAEPWRTAWEKIPDGTRVPANRVSVWAPRSLPEGAVNGHVALVGDAGHAMTFHRGQGMNHGIADAAKLTEELAAAWRDEKTQSEAVLEYEREMVGRAGEEVKTGRMNTEMMHDWTRFQESAFMRRGGDKNPGPSK